MFGLFSKFQLLFLHFYWQGFLLQVITHEIFCLWCTIRTRIDYSDLRIRISIVQKLQRVLSSGFDLAVQTYFFSFLALVSFIKDQVTASIMKKCFEFKKISELVTLWAASESCSSKCQCSKTAEKNSLFRGIKLCFHRVYVPDFSYQILNRKL